MRLRLVLLVFLAACGLASAQTHLGKTLNQWAADLDSSDRFDRLLAARSIGEMAIANTRGASKVLIKAASHNDSAVRYWAVVALGQMSKRPRSAVKLLQAGLVDEAPEVRVWSAYALAQSGRGAQAMPVLAKLMAHPNDTTRLHAAHALDSLGTDAAGATDALKSALEDDFGYVQRVARHALWTLGERACPYTECE